MRMDLERYNKYNEGKAPLPVLFVFSWFSNSFVSAFSNLNLMAAVLSFKTEGNVT